MPMWWSDLTAHARVLLALLAAIVLVGALTVVAAVGNDDGTDSVATTGSSTTSPSTTTSSTGPDVVAVTEPTTGATTTVVTISTDATSATTRGTSAPGATTTTAARSTTSTRTTAGSTTTTATAPPTCTATSTGPVADELASRYCSHRATQGLAPMKRTSELDSMAQQWAQHMADNQSLEHRSDAAVRAGVQEACPSCTRWAENIAYNASAKGAWQEWLASSTHKANIDRDIAGEFGIGAAFAGGYWWVVQNFGHYG